MAETAPKVFTARMLSKRWACSENVVYTMIKEGKLKAFKVGETLLRIRLSEVERWEQQESAGGDTPLVNTALDGTGVVQSLSGSMKAANVTKRHSGPQTKALQELHSINSRQKQN